jgi:hypothetical protein
MRQRPVPCHAVVVGRWEVDGTGVVEVSGDDVRYCLLVLYE